MKMNRGFALVLMVLVATLLISTAFAQETTASIQGTVKDTSGAVVGNAAVEITGAALIGSKKVQTDGNGLYMITGLPPGQYSMTITAQGFRAYKHSGIDLSAGRLPILDVQLQVGAASETVEVTSEAPIVDVTQSKVQVTVGAETLSSIPKGRSFQSVIPFAPGARQEPLSSGRNGERNSGFMIDGATDSENVYMVDGVNVTNVQNGGVGSNFQMDFIQEVQVKSSSFEAEYGGALGGVINAVPKRGSSNWHGEFKLYARLSSMNATDPCNVPGSPNATAQLGVNCFLRSVPGISTSGRIAPPSEYYHVKKDSRRIYEPGFDIGGALVKDRLWLFAGYIPTLDSLSRTIKFTGTNPGPRELRTNNTQHNAYTRLDYRMFDQLRLFGSWNYAYQRWTGPQLNPDSTTGQTNTSASTDPSTLIPQQGVVVPSAVYNFGGDWTPTSKMVVTVRYGYTFLNTADRGKAVGLKDSYSNSLVASSGAANEDANGHPINGNPCSTDITGACIKAPAAGPAVPFNTGGFTNLGDNFQTLYDAFKRKTWNADTSYFVGHLGGSHNFKFGFAWMDQNNNVLSAFNFARVNFTWSDKYTPQTSSACDAVKAQNLATYGAGAQFVNDCRGKYGYFTVTDGVDNNGNASGKAKALYFQDAWTVGHGLTLNLGVRFDNETVPPYDPGRFQAINFGWGSKIAPRLGAAYDLFHNGKVKLYGSYGKFYDITKLGLARGSFGSDYWHDCTYALDDYVIGNVTPTAAGGHSCPASGGAPGVTGRLIENLNLRSTKVDPRDPAVDPNIKPIEQHEFVAGADWAISPSWSLETRYSRKTLDRTIEDMAITDALGFYIGNPGSAFNNHILHGPTVLECDTNPLTNHGFACPGLSPDGNYLNSIPFCADCPNAVPAIRQYDGVEFRLSKRPGSGRWFGSASYTYSKLHGNYAGLTNTDITDGNGGRHSPNNHRAFDIPSMTFLPNGKIDDGPLATDRPNTFKLFGAYRIPWFHQETTIGFSQSAFQGSPNSTCISVIGSSSACQWAEGRGNFVRFNRAANGDFSVASIERNSRTDAFLQTDLTIHHEFKLSKTNEAQRLAFDGNVINLFNQHAVMALQELAFSTGTLTAPLPVAGLRFNNDPGFDWKKLTTGYDYIQQINTEGRIMSGTYGKPILFQGARNIRLALRYLW